MLEEVTITGIRSKRSLIDWSVACAAALQRLTSYFARAGWFIR
jgi:hypothetical protein